MNGIQKMKRSEMIERLNAFIKLHVDETYAKTSTKRLAQSVLDLCEASGMKPPPYQENFKIEQEGNVYWQVDLKHQWEKEGETK